MPGRREASIEAEGAIIGAIGLLAFALVATFGIKTMGAIPALIAAAAVWLLVSVAIYAALMTWRAATSKQPRKAPPG